MLSVVLVHLLGYLRLVLQTYFGECVKAASEALYRCSGLLDLLPDPLAYFLLLLLELQELRFHCFSHLRRECVQVQEDPEIFLGGAYLKLIEEVFLESHAFDDCEHLFVDFLVLHLGDVVDLLYRLVYVLVLAVHCVPDALVFSVLCMEGGQESLD